MSKIIQVILFALLLPLGGMSQVLWGKQEAGNDHGLFGKGSVDISVNAITNQDFGGTNGTITNQPFGQDVPLGTGLFILLAMGAGYAANKKNKKTNHKNRN